MTIQEYLTKQGVQFRSHHHRPAYTAQELAAEEHVSGKKTAKAVIVRTPEQYIMCVLAASSKLDLNRVARAMNARSAWLADEVEMAELFPDSEVGAEPPFGSLYNLPLLMDEQLARQDEITFEAGTHQESIHMKLQDYLAVAHPQVADIALHS